MKKTFTIESDGFTVKDLMEILKDANPNALILVGRDPDDCSNYLYQVITRKSCVGFFTEPDED